METPSTVQGESEEHLASLPVGYHRFLKHNVRVLFFLRTQLNRKHKIEDNSLLLTSNQFARDEAVLTSWMERL